MLEIMKICILIFFTFLSIQTISQNSVDSVLWINKDTISNVRIAYLPNGKVSYKEYYTVLQNQKESLSNIDSIQLHYYDIKWRLVETYTTKSIDRDLWNSKNEPFSLDVNPTKLEGVKYSEQIIQLHLTNNYPQYCTLRIQYKVDYFRFEEKLYLNPFEEEIIYWLVEIPKGSTEGSIEIYKDDSLSKLVKVELLGYDVSKKSFISNRESHQKVIRLNKGEDLIIGDLNDYKLIKVSSPKYVKYYSPVNRISHINTANMKKGEYSLGFFNLLGDPPKSLTLIVE